MKTVISLILMWLGYQHSLSFYKQVSKAVMKEVPEGSEVFFTKLKMLAPDLFWGTVIFALILGGLYLLNKKKR